MPGRENMTLEGVQSSRFLYWQRCLRTTSQERRGSSLAPNATYLRGLGQKIRGTKRGERGKSLLAK